jgi:hypothetical protein
MLKRRQVETATSGGKDDLEEANSSLSPSSASFSSNKLTVGRGDDDEEVIREHRVNYKGILLSFLFLLLLFFYLYSKDTGDTMKLLNSLTSTQGTASNSHIIAINEPLASSSRDPPLDPPSARFASSIEKAIPPLPKMESSVAVVPKPATTPPAVSMDPPPPPPAAPVDLSELENEALELVQQLRKMKQSGVVMETDPTALALIPKAQSLLRDVLRLKYGPGPYYVSMGIKFPVSMTRPNLPQETNLILELGPIEFIPYSVYFFLEYILQEFKTGSFHRNAGHVLQAMLTGTKPQISFAWQEYSPSYPHQKYTLGYAGRPSGSRAIYISTVDNTHNHGPGSQGSKTEADCLFGKVTKQSHEIVQRMEKQPGAAGGAGWVSDPSNYITITSLELLPSSYRPPA